MRIHWTHGCPWSLRVAYPLETLANGEFLLHLKLIFNKIRSNNTSFSVQIIEYCVVFVEKNGFYIRNNNIYDKSVSNL